MPMSTPPSKRSIVKTLSVASGGRLWDNLTAVDQSHPLPLFVCLTYPLDFPGDWLMWKRHLHNFRREVMRLSVSAEGGPLAGAHPHGRVFVGGIWRLEAQRRGAPHFHILLWPRSPLDADALNRFRKWFAKKWNKICGVTDPVEKAKQIAVHEHEESCQQVTDSKDAAVKMGYLCKYLGKDSVHPDSQVFKNPVGRHWGVWNRGELQKPPEVVEISQKVYSRLRRVVYKKREAKIRERSKEVKKKKKLKGKEDFNRRSKVQKQIPGIKEFMTEKNSRILLDYFDPVPF